ncbi:MAG: Uma2 family endonuclease [Pseudomonadota bacterium]
MSEPASKNATYQDLDSLPENLVGELLAGELYASPRPAGPHAMAASTLGMGIGGPFHLGGGGGPGGWWILHEPELHLGGDVLVPDLAGWRRQHMPRIPDGVAFTVPPDWVCEVLSPTTHLRDRTLKMPIYAREGVGHLWLVDPRARLLDVYRLHEGRWLLLGSYGGAEEVRAEPFEAVTLSLGKLWGGGDEEPVLSEQA